jgi:acyl carrier protein
MDEVKIIVSKELKISIDQLRPETKIADLGAESLEVIEIIFALEEKFDINIPLKADDATRIVEPNEADANSTSLRLTTIGSVAQFVKVQIDAKAS